MSTGHPDSGLRLVADIGGTHARFAVAAPGSDKLSHDLELSTPDYPDLAAAVTDYLARAKPGRVTQAAVAIANPITGDRLKMTNGKWEFSVKETQKKLGLERLILLNDFAALALAVPVLSASALRKVGSEGKKAAEAPIALIGPGTGLGVSALIPDGGPGIPVAGEGGHVTAGATNAREEAILAFLRQRYEHVSAERLLSGPGMVNIHEALSAIDGKPAQKIEAPQITQQGLSGGDAQCVEVLELFCAWLGSVAGDCALTLGARGGVYIGGGIVPRLGSFFDRSTFRRRFIAKGRMGVLLEGIPVYIIDAPHAALAGSLVALEHNVRTGSNVEAR
ncbi:MAG TPA: glucokinase [Burkholderiales bacterium]|jgi:glucokinase